MPLRDDDHAPMLTGGALERHVGFQLDVRTAEDGAKQNRRRNEPGQKKSRAHDEEGDRQANEHAGEAERRTVPANPFQNSGERNDSGQRQPAASCGRRADQLDRTRQAQRADEHEQRLLQYRYGPREQAGQKQQHREAEECRRATERGADRPGRAAGLRHV